MKTLTGLKLLLISLFLLGSVQAARLSEEDKTDVRRQLDELITETKGGDGSISMDKFNVVAFQSLEEFHLDRKITREELIKFKESLDGIAVKVPPKDREAAIRDLFEKNLLAVDKSNKDLIKQGGICNHWDCEKGLECAPVPPRVEEGGRLKTGDAFCSSDKECFSGECSQGQDGKKRCEYTYRCYRPVAENQSCLENPVCGKGSCEEVFFSDANIGACVKNGVSCKSNLDCCSDSCVKGQCVENYKCQTCIKAGKLKRGQTCCVDQAVEKDGVCKPIVVPLNPFVQVIKGAIEIVFPSAHAVMQEIEQEGGGGGGGGGGGSTSSNPNAEYRNAAGSVNYMQGSGIAQDQLQSNGQEELSRFSIATNQPSNLETCDINLINDYAKKLSESRMPNSNVSMLEVELALLGFEYVAGGDNQIDDYWKGGNGNKTLHKRISEIAKKREQMRLAFFDDLRWFEPKVTCLCLEKTGWKNMTAEQKEFYENDCRLGLAIPPLENNTNNLSDQAIQAYREERDAKAAQMAESPESWSAKIAALKAADENHEVDEGDDASGVKALKLLETWAAANATIQEISLVISTMSMNDLDKVHQWLNTDAGWNSDTASNDRKQKLYNFEVKNSGGSSNPMLAVALLSAGVVAILGGFAFASTVSAWVSAAVITSAAASAGAGVWMISSLRGAWYSTAPYVEDMPAGNYKCGKSDTCFKFERWVHQPYNSVCNKHISANACIKSFAVADENGAKLMLVDPWIPQGISKGEIVKDSNDLANLLEQGWVSALDQMRKDIPYPSNFNSKAASSVYAWVSAGNTPMYGESQFQNTTITNKTLGKYAPKLKSNAEATYIISDAVKEKIITGAAEFLKAQGWASSEIDATAFGNYVYQNHFLWPKTAYSDVIAYPQPGLISYVGLVANGLATSGSVSFGSLGDFRQLENKYFCERLARETNEGSSVQDPRCGGRTGLDGGDGTRVAIDGNPNNGGTSTIDGNGNNTVGFNNLDGLSGFGAANMAGLNGNSGLLSGNSFGNGGFNASQFSSGVNAALSSLRDFRKRQKDAADEFKNNAGKTERGRRLLEKAEDFRDQFYSNSRSGGKAGGAGGASRAGNLLGSSGAGGAGATNLGNEGNANGDGTEGKTGFFGEGIGRNGNGGANGVGANGGAGSGYGFGSDYGNGGNGSGYGDGSGVGSGNGNGNGMSPEDARRLADAIKNRDNARDGDKYGRKDGMSLWEIVTNTYIRVYDRLLERKTKNNLD